MIPQLKFIKAFPGRAATASGLFCVSIWIQFFLKPNTYSTTVHAWDAISLAIACIALGVWKHTQPTDKQRSMQNAIQWLGLGAVLKMLWWIYLVHTGQNNGILP